MVNFGPIFKIPKSNEMYSRAKEHKSQVLEQSEGKFAILSVHPLEVNPRFSVEDYFVNYFLILLLFLAFNQSI